MVRYLWRLDLKSRHTVEQDSLLSIRFASNAFAFCHFDGKGHAAGN
jgi:hypothetical protein